MRTMPHDVGSRIANVDASEIEITPEMIKAGVAVYPAFDGRFENSYDEAVIEIFEAMWAARVKGHASITGQPPA